MRRRCFKCNIIKPEEYYPPVIETKEFICLKCLYPTKKLTYNCLKCERKFKAKNKFNKLCSECKRSGVFRDNPEVKRF